MGIPHNGRKRLSSQQWRTKARESGVSLASKGNGEKGDEGDKKRSERSQKNRASDSPEHLDCGDPASHGH